MNLSKYFYEGAIPAACVAEMLTILSNKKYLGAITIFCGQVRNDQKGNTEVEAINYSHYPSMAFETINQIIDSTLEAVPVHEIIVLHSIGKVMAGEISLIILVAAGHRKACLEAQHIVVETIKYQVPIWKNEIWKDNTSHWI
jgi:molybdopterin synthase catalytic subunit